MGIKKIHSKLCWNCKKIIYTGYSGKSRYSRGVPQSVFCSQKCKREYRSRVMKNIDAMEKVEKARKRLVKRTKMYK